MSLSLKIGLLAVSAAMLISASATSAWAVDPQQSQSFLAWKRQDRCAQQAFKASPDYTPAGNAKRDRLLRLCEAQNHVTVRGDLSDGHIPMRPDEPPSDNEQ